MGVVDRPITHLPKYLHIPIHQTQGIPDSVLRVGNKSGEVRTETSSGVLVRGLRIPSRFSPCKTHSREMAQTSGFVLTSQVKTCFDCKMFNVANWVARLNEALSVSPQGALEISSVAGQPPFLDRDLFSSPRVLAKSLKVMKGAVLHPKVFNSL